MSHRWHSFLYPHLQKQLEGAHAYGSLNSTKKKEKKKKTSERARSSLCHKKISHTKKRAERARSSPRPYLQIQGSLTPLPQPAHSHPTTPATRNPPHVPGHARNTVKHPSSSKKKQKQKIKQPRAPKGTLAEPPHPVVQWGRSVRWRPGHRDHRVSLLGKYEGRRRGAERRVFI